MLGQRFPQEVDSAVAKISRSVAKTKAPTSKATLREDVGSDDDDSDDIKAASQEAALREEALSSLLVSTFAGAELAHRLPLEQQQGEDVSVFWRFLRGGISSFFVCLAGVVHVSESFECPRSNT